MTFRLQTASKCEVNEDWDDSDTDLDLDSSLVLPSTGPCHLQGKLDIIYNHVYQVPAPYIQLWQPNSGQSLTCAEALCALSPADVPESSDEPNTIVDHTIYLMGKWMPEPHPETGQMVLSLHLCDLSRLLEPLLQSAATHCSDEFERTGERSEEKTTIDRVYLLVWFSFVSRFMGMTIPPNLFKRWYECLLTS